VWVKTYLVQHLWTLKPSWLLHHVESVAGNFLNDVINCNKLCLNICQNPNQVVTFRKRWYKIQRISSYMSIPFSTFCIKKTHAKWITLGFSQLKSTSSNNFISSDCEIVLLLSFYQTKLSIRLILNSTLAERCNM